MKVRRIAPMIHSLLYRYIGTTPKTFILRENLYATFEAPFMYLLIGSRKALLIDTGDVADPNQMPLAKTVVVLVARRFICKAPLACGPHSPAR
jgi:hypothetical protein